MMYSKASDYAKPGAVKQMIGLLTIPLDNYKNVLTVLKLTNYKKLTDYLNYDSRKKVAISILPTLHSTNILWHSKDTIKNTIEHETIVGEPYDAEKLLDLIQPLLKDETDQPAAEDVDKVPFGPPFCSFTSFPLSSDSPLLLTSHVRRTSRRNRISLDHLCTRSTVKILANYTKYPQVIWRRERRSPVKVRGRGVRKCLPFLRHTQIYLTARKAFAQGGPTRIRHTMIPLVFRTLRLVGRIKEQRTSGAMALDDEDWDKIGKKLFQFAHETITQIAKLKFSEESLRLFLQAAQSASFCEFESVAYQFILYYLSHF